LKLKCKNLYIKFYINSRQNYKLFYYSTGFKLGWKIYPLWPGKTLIDLLTCFTETNLIFIILKEK